MDSEERALQLASGYSELYARLGAIVRGDALLSSILDAAPPHQRMSQLLMAALHDRVMAHPEAPLARWYPSVTGRPAPDDDPEPALRLFFANQRDALREIVATRNTQTCEPLRCAPLLFALAAAAELAQKPLGIIELGAAAGLLLLFDRYAYEYPGLGSLGDACSPVRLVCELRGPGRPPLPAGLPAVGSRIGIDIAPIDVGSETATRWLEACVLADRLDRMERLRASLRLARSDPPRLVHGDLVEQLASVAAQVPEDQHLCLLDSYSLLYLPPARRTELALRISELGRRRDLSWISSERPGTIPGLDEPEPPEDPNCTFLTLSTVHRGERSDRVLARCHTHGGWMEWL